MSSPGSSRGRARDPLEVLLTRAHHELAVDDRRAGDEHRVGGHLHRAIERHRELQARESERGEHGTQEVTPARERVGEPLGISESHPQPAVLEVGGDQCGAREVPEQVAVEVDARGLQRRQRSLERADGLRVERLPHPARERGGRRRFTQPGAQRAELRDQRSIRARRNGQVARDEVALRGVERGGRGDAPRVGADGQRHPLERRDPRDLPQLREVGPRQREGRADAEPHGRAGRRALQPLAQRGRCEPPPLGLAVERELQRVRVLGQEQHCARAGVGGRPVLRAEELRVAIGAGRIEALALDRCLHAFAQRTRVTHAPRRQRRAVHREIGEIGERHRHRVARLSLERVEVESRLRGPACRLPQQEFGGRHALQPPRERAGLTALQLRRDQPDPERLLRQIRQRIPHGIGARRGRSVVPAADQHGDENQRAGRQTTEHRGTVPRRHVTRWCAGALRSIVARRVSSVGRAHD
ncbi:hypothetical protein LRS13_01530 [Svornostia abyssi]|uniref:Uncharacterized protein n=1 Tax=Svornostia abyssi TaxID=2898438 RepID=A0ABY5PI87_9ACTN|nr:hypothetical protein LRS13_01530 [Parviterribacteraceae bacterium J379]